MVNSRFLADEAPRIASLATRQAFDGLTEQEKLYSYHLARAAWAGRPIIQHQLVPYAADLYRFLLLLFSAEDSSRKPCNFEQLQKDSKVADDDFQALLSYSAQVVANLTNYKSFGNTKFIPRIHQDKYQAVVKACPNSKQVLPLWELLKHDIYSTEPSAILQVGEPSKGHMSNYYPISGNVKPPTQEEVMQVQQILDQKKVSSINTRMTKLGEKTYRVLVASVDKRIVKLQDSSEGLHIELEYGDFSNELANCIEHLRKAIECAGSDLRKQYLQGYIDSFQSGSITAHEKASEKWVQDASPPVENYLGFIESYQEPYSLRAEWEGFVAVVNKDLSEKFTKMVEGAAGFLALFPWGKDWEVKTFRKPDYTALEILSFATGGLPAGINLPNYDVVREKVGYKNVSLVNVLSVPPRKEDIKFIKDEERDLFADWTQKSFEVQVAIHELLGHGSGKLLRQEEDGSFNFDKDHLKNPLTGKLVDSWYNHGETPGSRIGAVYGSMEEMRAEAAALYLCGNSDILSIFSHTSQEEKDTIQYVVYLTMAHAGLRALEMYDPATKKHGQAHMQARLGIFRWMMKDQIASLDVQKDEKGDISDVLVAVNRKAVLDGRGKECVGRLLMELQIRKSTGDGKGATKFYNEITSVPDEWAGPIRDFVIANKVARKLLLQPNMFLQGNQVILKEYEPTFEGLLASYIEKED